MSRRIFLAKFVFASVVTVLIATDRGDAATIGLGGFSGSATLVDFTGLTVAGTAAPITVGTLTMDSSVSSLGIGDLTYVFAETPLDSMGGGLQDNTTAISDIDLMFVTPMNRLGLWINGGNAATSYTLSAYDAGNNLIGSEVFAYSLFNGFPDPSTFAGIEFTTSFVRVNILESGGNGQYTNIDDVRYEAVAAPEPATVFTLGLGLAGLAGMRRRRTA